MICVSWEENTRGGGPPCHQRTSWPCTSSSWRSEPSHSLREPTSGPSSSERNMDHSYDCNKPRYGWLFFCLLHFWPCLIMLTSCSKQKSDIFGLIGSHCLLLYEFLTVANTYSHLLSETPHCYSVSDLAGIQVSKVWGHLAIATHPSVEIPFNKNSCHQCLRCISDQF